MRNLVKQTKRVVSQIAQHRIIKGYDEFISSEIRGRALLSYLVHPLLLPRRFRNHTQFSNQGIAQELARTLNELGYVLDIVDYRNATWLPSSQYDIFLGHGGYNFKSIVNYLNQSTFRIYFATGCYWREQNHRASIRLAELASRRGILLPQERVAPETEEFGNRNAHRIICLGNQHAANTFSDFPDVKYINNAAYPITFAKQEADFDEGRKHFLFFSGSGNVHKGLDLLLDVFARTDLHLHICQHISTDFAKLYEKELYESPNIHVEGFVKMRTSRFAELAHTCNWVILPSCAEGQPGSVLECMAYGLIPILPDSANIDMYDDSIRISALNVAGLRDSVQATQEWTVDKCILASKRTIEQVRDHYSPDDFREALKRALAH